MNLEKISREHQRWLAVGLLVLVVLLVSSLIIWPILSKGMELSETKENLAFTLKKIRTHPCRQRQCTEKHRCHRTTKP